MPTSGSYSAFACTVPRPTIANVHSRAALKNHPDRVPADSPDRKTRTHKFQLVNDAYFTLSDAGRRREYDAQRHLFQRRGGAGSTYSFPNEDDEEETNTDYHPHGNSAGPGSGSGTGTGASWAWNYFTRATGGDQHQEGSAEARQRTEDAQFADVFEEMLREEGMAEPATGRPTGKFWGFLGGVSGATLGFIVANVPGMVAGAVAGNRLGAIRDAKGKSVYAVYQELPPDDRSRLLGQLAARVFSHAVGI